MAYNPGMVTSMHERCPSPVSDGGGAPVRRVMSTRLLWLLVLACALHTPAWGRIKCWTDADGNRECGDKVPPEYSQQGHEVRDEEGLVVERVDKAATAEEIDQLKQQQQQDEEARRQAEIQKRMDEVLLRTFADESDITRSQNDKVQTLDGQITLTGERIKKLEAQLQTVQERIQFYQDKGDPPPEHLVQTVRSTQSQITDNQQFIETKRAEQQQIIADHEAQLQRFRELTSGTP